MASPSTPSTIQFIQAQPFTLAGSGSSIGDVTILLNSMIGIDGNNILTADLGSFSYGTIEPGNGTQEEAVLFTGITQNANGTATLTGVSSLSFKQPYTLTTGLTKTHAGASKFILSNDAAFYNNLILYMNAIAGAGAANASTAVKGLVQAATTAQINAGTATGSTGAVLAITPDAFLASTFVLASGTTSALAGTSGTPSATNKFVTQASLKFGGTGADGALTITSGTTTIDCTSTAVLTKNYTSISITGTGKLAFSNPHANGTLVVLKSQGGVTITSSTVPAIDCSGIGATASTAGQGNFGANTNTGGSVTDLSGGAPGTGGTATTVGINMVKNILISCGAGGGKGCSTAGGTTGSGGGGGGSSSINSGATGSTGNGTASQNANNNGGAGGRGGGALYIECAGAYSCSSTLTVAGLVGTAGASAGAGGGGGGGGGSIAIRYTTLTSDTGTYTLTGGAGGAGVANSGGSGGAGGTGGTGYSSISINVDFL